MKPPPALVLNVIVVTLYVRVWIETFVTQVQQIDPYVTLYVRVWIETLCSYPYRYPVQCHPLREGVD